MENKVGIEYKPKIECEASNREEIEHLFNQVDEALEEEERKEEKATADEESKWKEQEEKFQALLKKEGCTEDGIRSEVIEVVKNVLKQKE